jgi:hypothetical protein
MEKRIRTVFFGEREIEKNFIVSCPLSPEIDQKKKFDFILEKHSFFFYENKTIARGKILVNIQPRLFVEVKKSEK